MTQTPDQTQTAQPTIDATLVADLGNKIGELEAGKASKQDIEELRASLEEIKVSQTAMISRSDYDALTARLDGITKAQEAMNQAPAKIEPPAKPPGPTDAQGVGADGQTGTGKPVKGKERSRFGLRLF